jgi:hypothetical protein
METYMDTCSFPLAGDELIEDVAACLVEGLKGDCDLRPVDAYESYSARITIELQLNSLGIRQIDKTIIVGGFDSAQTSDIKVDLEIPLTLPEESRERGCIPSPRLEGHASPEPELPQPEVKKRRFYCPRQRTAKGV